MDLDGLISEYWVRTLVKRTIITIIIIIIIITIIIIIIIIKALSWYTLLFMFI